MRVISLRALREFWEIHPSAGEPLRAWYAIASRAHWTNPADIKAAYRSASFLPGNRVVFNIKGNSYRLIVAIHYDRQLLYIRFVSTHAEYDRSDARTI